MPSPGKREAVPGAVADEEHAVLGRGAQAVREPVALVARGLAPPAGRRAPPSAALTWSRGVVGADADARLAAGGDAPAVAAAHEVALDPDVERVAGRSARAGGPRARARAARRAAGRAGRPSTRRQPSASTTSGGAQVAAVGATTTSPSARPRGPRPSRSRSGRRRTAPTARGRARGSRRPTSSRAGGSARVPCGVVKRHVRQLLADRRRRRPSRAATASGRRRRDVARSPIS